MPKTRDDLVRRTLEYLLVASAGQSISAEDAEFVKEHIDTYFARLLGLNIVNLTAGSIPDQIFNGLATGLGETVAPGFGRPTDEATRDRAEDEIERIVKRTPSTGPLRTDPALRRSARRVYGEAY